MPIEPGAASARDDGATYHPRRVDRFTTVSPDIHVLRTARYAQATLLYRMHAFTMHSMHVLLHMHVSLPTMDAYNRDACIVVPYLLERQAYSSAAKPDDPISPQLGSACPLVSLHSYLASSACPHSAYTVLRLFAAHH